MICPRLSDLPPPPADRTGWPWTAESSSIANDMSTGDDWPRISIVTPSYNRAEFLEAAIRSVLLQGYPNLEYILMDGGGSEACVAIVKKYEPWLTFWCSESDKGQYGAINSGFRRSTGTIMASLNSDDMYHLGALATIARVFNALGDDVQWITGIPCRWDANGRLAHAGTAPRFPRAWIRSGLYEGRKLGWIQQESTFWRRSLWDVAGGYVNSALRYAGDYDLWRRFAKHATLYAVQVPLAGIRCHDRRKSALDMDAYYAEIDEILRNSPWRERILHGPFRYPLPQRVAWNLAKLLAGNHLISYDFQRDTWFRHG